MFRNIVFTIYGRSTMHTDWNIYPPVGINRLYYVHSGSAIYKRGNVKKTLMPGNIYLFPQNLEFTLSMEDCTDFDHTYFDFFCTPPLIFENEISINPQEYPLIKLMQEGLFTLAETFPLLNVLEHNSYSDAISCAFAALLDTIHNEYALPLALDCEISSIVEYIHLHFREKISVSKLAENLHLEENVFIRKFKRHIGTTPYQYIKNLRLTYAISMIRSENYTLNTVAFLCGYNDAVSLSHAIKSEYGKYPGQLPKITKRT